MDERQRKTKAMMRSSFFSAACAVMMLGAILGCGNASRSPSSQQPTAVSNEPPIRISAEELIKAYKENEVGADAKYRGKRLHVSGEISNIADTLGSITVSLKGENESGLLTVLCSFDDAYRASIATLKKGEPLGVVGRGDGMTAGLYVGLEDCGFP